MFHTEADMREVHKSLLTGNDGHLDHRKHEFMFFGLNRLHVNSQRFISRTVWMTQKCSHGRLLICNQ